MVARRNRKDGLHKGGAGMDSVARNRDAARKSTLSTNEMKSNPILVSRTVLLQHLAD